MTDEKTHDAKEGRPPDAPKPESTDPLSLTGITPATTFLGSEDFEIRAHGSGFSNNSMITFNRENLATTFHDSHELSAMVESSDITVAAVYPVTVKHGSIESNPVDFTVTPALTAEEKAARDKAKKAKEAPEPPKQGGPGTPSRPTVPPPPPQRGPTYPQPPHGSGPKPKEPEKGHEKPSEPDHDRDLPKSRR